MLGSQMIMQICHPSHWVLLQLIIMYHKNTFAQFIGAASILLLIVLVTGCRVPENDITVSERSPEPTMEMITSSPTETSSSPIEPTATPTITPGESSAGGVTATQEKELGENIIVFRSFEHQLFIADLDAGTRRKIGDGGNGDPTAFFSWANQGCTLVLGTNDGRIIRTDLHGNSYGEITNLQHLGLTEVPFKWHLSTNERFLLFITGYGEQGYASYEYQDLFYVDLSGPGEIAQLTTQNHTSIVSMSSERDVFAFDAMDSQGVPQAFVFDLAARDLFQLTDHSSKQRGIRAISWSPDGKLLAVSRSDGASWSTDVYKFGVETGEYSQFSSFLLSAHNLWWHTESILGGQGVLVDGSAIENGIFWINVESGELIRKLDDESIPGGGGVFLKPINPIEIGMISGSNDFISYNFVDNIFSEPVSIFHDLLVSYWFPGAEDYESELACQGQ